MNRCGLIFLSATSLFSVNAYSDWWRDSTIIYGLAFNGNVGTTQASWHSGPALDMDMGGGTMNLGYLYDKSFVNISLYSAHGSLMDDDFRINSVSALPSSLGATTNYRVVHDNGEIDHIEILVGYKVWRQLSLFTGYRSGGQDWQAEGRANLDGESLELIERVEELVDYSNLLFGTSYNFRLGNGSVNVQLTLGKGSGDKSTRLTSRVSDVNSFVFSASGGFDLTAQQVSLSGGDYDYSNFGVKYTHSWTRNSVYSLGIGYITQDFSWDDGSSLKLSSGQINLGWSYLF